MNASPKNAGTISGFNEPVHPSRTKMMYSGTIVTWLGSISVDSTSRNAPSRHFHRMRASA